MGKLHSSAKSHGIAVCQFIFKWRHRPLTAWNAQSSISCEVFSRESG
jgi:hypothetical protein